MQLHRLPVAVLTAFSLAACVAAGNLNSGEPLGSGGEISADFAGGQTLVAVDLYGANHDQLTQLGRLGMDVWAHDRQRVRGTIPAKAWPLVTKWGLKAVKLPNQHALNHFDPSYHTFDQMQAELTGLATRYPQICSLVELGKSFEGRPILALKVGVGDTSAKPGVLFTGENHARELVTPEIVLRIAHWMLDGYGKDAEATFAVERRETWLTPMVNPDGHVKAEQGLDWRKNTSTKYGGVGEGPDGPGVDLNRNYDDRNWGSTGTDHDPSGATYGGPGPFTEPETQAMRGLYTRRNFTFLLTWHSFSNSVMWPWNDNSEPPADKRMPAIGAALGHLSGYEAYQGDQMYDTSGDDTDYCYGKLGIISFTIEVGGWGDGFDPPYSALDKFNLENLPMAQYIEKIADNPGSVFGASVDQPGAFVLQSILQTQAGGKLLVRRARSNDGILGVPAISWLGG